MITDIEDPRQLEDYLRSTGRIGACEKISSRVLDGGVSNRTVWVRRQNGTCWVLKQALAKLRVKVDWFSDPARAEREALGLRWLAKLAPPGAITPLVFEDKAHHLLAMQAVPQPHENFKTMLLAGRVDPAHVQQFARLLGQIHRRSAEQADALARLFDDRSFFETLRLEPYYSYAAEQEPRAAEFLRQLVEETRATRIAIVHGDYSPKNILIHNGRLILLDHEVIHWGDPAFDVGFALTHFLSKAHHLIALRDSFRRAAVEFWDQYSLTISGMPDANALDQRAARHTLACMLARVAGRSPLEYLSDEQRHRQREIIVAMMNESHANSLADVIAEFISRLD